MQPTPEININNPPPIRPSLQLSFFDLCEHMRQLGWVTHLSMFDGKRGWIAFSKQDPWHNRPTLANTCKYGYALPDGSTETLKQVSQKAAEICLTIYESFAPTAERPALLPDNPNIYGVVRASPISNKAPYIYDTWDAYKARHLDKELSLRVLPQSGLHGSYFGAVICVDPWKKKEFMHQIAHVEQIANGHLAGGN